MGTSFQHTWQGSRSWSAPIPSKVTRAPRNPQAVYADVVAALERAGGGFAGARGLPDALLAAAVARGVAKVNVDTDLRLAFAASARATLAGDAAALDPKKILGAARDAVRAMARRRIRACRPAAAQK